jgi:hypothetical protein
MKTKHTPGPWVVHEDETWPFDIRIVGAKGEEIIDARRWAYSTSQKTLADVMAGVGFRAVEVREVVERNARQMDNMRLMGAALDMLEACRICLKAERERAAKLLPGAPARTYTDARIAKIEAAIAKATGEDA